MNLSGFDLNLLRVLDALLHEKSTVRAAERVGLSQPAVSAALGRLRLALDDPLFVRHGQRILPTEFAASLEIPLRQVLDSLSELLSRQDDFDPRSSDGRFKIAGSDYFAEMLMPSLAQLLATEVPRVKVQLVELVPDNYVASLESLDVDMALVPKVDFPSWVAFQPAFLSSFVMVARQGHPRLARAGVQPYDTVPMDLFCDLSHIAFSPEGKLKAMGDAALARLGRERNVVMTMPVFGGICSAVSESDLVALLPRPLAQKMAAQKGLSIYVAPVPLPTAQICMIWHKRNNGNAAHRWLRETVLAQLSAAETSEQGESRKDSAQ